MSSTRVTIVHRRRAALIPMAVLAAQGIDSTAAIEVGDGVSDRDLHDVGHPVRLQKCPESPVTPRGGIGGHALGAAAVDQLGVQQSTSRICNGR
jgi:hypothetical protein